LFVDSSNVPGEHNRICLVKTNQRAVDRDRGCIGTFRNRWRMTNTDLLVPA
jgi:hypothetical protein